MDCRQIDRLLEANLDGRLSGFERVGLRQHLKSCRVCRAKVEAMTAFSDRMEKTLAGAGGPDWRRLAPPAATTEPSRARAPALPRPGQPTVPPRPTATATRRAKRPRSSLGIAVAGVAIIAVVLPFWTPRAPVSPAPWLAEVIGAEATRRAAGRGPDLATDDPAAAAEWLAARGLAPVPALQWPPSVALEGAFVTYYEGGRVGGLVLSTPAGPLAVHLLPAGPASAPEAPASAAADGLEALGVGTGRRRAAVVGRPEAIDGSGVAGWAPDLLAAPAAR